MLVRGKETPKTKGSKSSGQVRTLSGRPCRRSTGYALTHLNGALVSTRNLSSCAMYPAASCVNTPCHGGYEVEHGEGVGRGHVHVPVHPQPRQPRVQVAKGGHEADLELRVVPREHLAAHGYAAARCTCLKEVLPYISSTLSAHCGLLFGGGGWGLGLSLWIKHGEYENLRDSDHRRITLYVHRDVCVLLCVV
jgi:hypothetical protein